MIPRTHLLIMLSLVAAEFIISAVYYPRLPDPAPIHWNIHGVADDFGPSWVAAFLGPGISLGIVLVMTFLPLAGPFRANFEQFRTIYGRIGVVLTAVFAGLQVVILMKSLQSDIHMGGAICFILGLMFIALGNWMGKLRRNFYIGIRTPWTIANDVVWERTHRLGGRLMVAGGVISAVTGLIAPDSVCFYVLTGSVALAAGGSALYSFWCYRRLGRVDELESV